MTVTVRVDEQRRYASDGNGGLSNGGAWTCRAGPEYSREGAMIGSAAGRARIGVYTKG